MKTITICPQDWTHLHPSFIHSQISQSICSLESSEEIVFKGHKQTNNLKKMIKTTH